MSIAHCRSIQFAGWEIRPIERLLLVDGAPVAIGSRAFDVLLALIDRSGEVVRRDDLLDAAWPGLVVEENNLSVQVATLRKTLGAQVIATIPGIGYRFTALLRQAPAAATEANPGALPPSPAGLRAGAPAPPQLAPPSPQTNLPPRLPELIGREADLDELVDLVRGHRMVCAVGAGGIGKTRLALAAACRLREAFADGAWMVELSPLSDPSLLAATIAQAIGLRLPGRRPAADELVEALGDSRLLLVLDNCEHLVDAVSALVQAVIGRCAGTSVLATSQELLKIPEEHVYRVPPLSLPVGDDLSSASEHGALRLLAQRVRALDRRFQLGAGNAADAVDVCRRLDGLPLAIELAAARVPLLGLAGVRQRLDERFQVLTGGSRTGPRRHRALRETLAWSHGLLNAGERAIFRRAGVFAGGFTMEQAQTVLGDDGIDGWAVLELLGGLVDKSLVVVDAADPPRYRLLESARAYALEMLHEAGEGRSVRLRHAAAMKDHFDESLRLQWQWPSQRRLQRYLPDLDNGRAALAWAGPTEHALYIALAGALAWLFSLTGHRREGLAHCRRALELVGSSTPPALQARLQQELAGLLHDNSSAEKLHAAQRAVALWRQADDAAAVYVALGRLAISASLCDDLGIAAQAVDEMARLWQPGWPALARWDLLNARDYVANLSDHVDEGKALAEEQLALAEAADDSFKRLFAMMALEQCVATRGDFADAVDRGRELVALARRERYVEKLHIYIANLATALVMLGHVDEALPLASETAAMDLRRDSLWQSLDMLAMLALRRGRPADAARVLGRADAANAWRGGDFREPVEKRVRASLLQALQQVLTPAELAALAAEGALLSDEAAAARALAD